MVVGLNELSLVWELCLTAESQRYCRYSLLLYISLCVVTYVYESMRPGWSDLRANDQSRLVFERDKEKNCILNCGVLPVELWCVIREFSGQTTLLLAPYIWVQVKVHFIIYFPWDACVWICFGNSVKKTFMPIKLLWIACLWNVDFLKACTWRVADQLFKAWKSLEWNPK